MKTTIAILMATAVIVVAQPFVPSHNMPKTTWTTDGTNLVQTTAVTMSKAQLLAQQARLTQQITVLTNQLAQVNAALALTK